MFLYRQYAIYSHNNCNGNTVYIAVEIQTERYKYLQCTYIHNSHNTHLKGIMCEYNTFAPIVLGFFLYVNRIADVHFHLVAMSRNELIQPSVRGFQQF